MQRRLRILDGCLALALLVVAVPECISQSQMTAEEHLNRGLELTKKGNLDGAISEYRVAVQMNPNFFDARTNLGTALAEKGDFNGAVAAYRQAARIKPDYHVAALMFRFFVQR